MNLQQETNTSSEPQANHLGFLDGRLNHTIAFLFLIILWPYDNTNILKTRQNPQVEKEEKR